MDLRSLRLNCLLTPLVPTVLGLAALLVQHLLVEDDRRAREQDEAGRQLLAWAASESTPVLAARDDRWRVVGFLRLVGDQLESPPGLPEAPTPELVQVVHGPQVWTTPDGHVAVAVQAAGGEGRILYGERRPDPTTPLPLMPAALLLTCGLLLGGYLARRVYRPVEWLTREAQAALEGQPTPPGAGTSAETATLHSSVVQLADRYRSSSRHG